MWPIHCPIGALSRVALWARNLPEAFVEGQVVPNGVLPPATRPAVIRKCVADPGVDVIQTQLPLRGRVDRHGNEGGIAVGGLPFGTGQRGAGRD